MFDIQGKLCSQIVQSINEGNSHFKIDVRDLSPGIYILNAKWGNENIQPVKVVIKGF